MRKLLQIAIVVFAATLTACATTPNLAGSRVVDADAAMTSGCQFVGEVHGSSGWGNLAASTGMENAKTEARERAGEMGATHIVWGSITGGYSPSAVGKAYKC